jgi:PTS system ascorbate-specific IIA component
MVSLLIISHGNIGTAMLEAATTMLETCPLKTEVIDVSPVADTDEIQNRAYDLVTQLDDGDGVLVLTDMYGSTPSNISCKLQMHENVRVIGGLNLPMLIRVLNYPNLGLDQLVEKAISGGKDGVLTCQIDRS